MDAVPAARNVKQVAESDVSAPPAARTNHEGTAHNERVLGWKLIIRSLAAQRLGTEYVSADLPYIVQGLGRVR